MIEKRVFGRVPAHPDLMAKIRKTKQLVRSGVDLSSVAGPDVLDLRTFAKIISRPKSSRAHTLVSPTRQFSPAVGTVRGLVLLVDFSDNENSEQLAHFEELLFSQGIYPTGSMRDYYHEISYGQLNVIGDLYGWYRAPQTYSYYTNDNYGLGYYPQNVHKLVEDVIELARADVNFADYDLNGDGYVDALFIVHAGPGAEATGNSDHIWSHRSAVFPPIYVNGTRVSGYTMEPEDGRIGVFSHELGHNFGLPDLYDTDYDSSGVGDWCLMAGGSWNNNGQTPAHMSAWCKMKLGWVTPRVVFDAERAVSLASAANSAEMIKLPIGDPTSKEYFLIENRHNEGFDQALPGEGLLIWHIDENQINNDDQNHFLVGLEQADGLGELEKGIDDGDSGDPFPGSTDNRAFNADTDPNSRAYDGSDSKIATSNISDSGPTMNLTVRVGEVLGPGTLGDRSAADLLGVSRRIATKLEDSGIATISQVAEMDVLPLAPGVDQDPLKLFGYKARAQSVAAFNLDATPFQAVRQMKISEILEESRENLANTTGQSEDAIVGLKEQLARLAAALDIRVLRQLTLADIA